MPRETGIVVDERTEWPDRNSVRHRWHCADCGMRAKFTGGPITVIDSLIATAIDAHAATCQGDTHA